MRFIFIKLQMGCINLLCHQFEVGKEDWTINLEIKIYKQKKKLNNGITKYFDILKIKENSL